MAGSSTATVAYLYKTTYAGDLGIVSRRRHTLLSQITKTGGFTGNNFTYPMEFANPGAVGGGFTNNQTNANSSKGVAFVALRRTKYGLITLDGPSMMACDSKGSFANLVTRQTDGVIAEMNNRLAFDLYRDGTGVRGQRSSIAGNVVTLVNSADARNFSPNMVVVADDSAGGLSPGAGTTTVTAVSLSAGTVTLASAAALIGFSDNWYLFADGDSSSGTATCMEGMELCTPVSEPVLTVDSFRSVDRGPYPALLAGSRIDDTSTVIEVNAGKVAVQINACGADGVTSMVVNPLNFFNIMQRLNAKVEYQSAGGEATWGFETIRLATAAGIISVYSDPDCPTNRFRMYNPASHYIRTLGELVHTIMDDNNGPSMRVYNADSIEIRIRSMNNYIQSDTRNHAVGTI